MTDHRTTDSTPAPDVESDPARDDRLGSDWSDEGGAAPSGPATSTGADAPDADDAESDAAGDRDDTRPPQHEKVPGSPVTLDPPD